MSPALGAPQPAAPRFRRLLPTGPLPERQEAGAGTMEDDGPSGAGQCELRILLIEDSGPIKERLTIMLSEAGVMRIAGVAATEREARTRIDQAQYDVLLVDVELEEGSGIGAIRHARAHYAGSRQPLIVVLTNYPLPAIRSRCFAAGADHFLDKMHQFQDVKGLIAGAPRIAHG